MHIALLSTTDLLTKVVSFKEKQKKTDFASRPCLWKDKIKNILIYNVTSSDTMPKVWAMLILLMEQIDRQIWHSQIGFAS